MAKQKITQTQVSQELHSDSFVLVTEPVMDESGTEVESLRRLSVNVLLGDVKREIADLKYVPIDITSISNTAGTVELGSTVDSVTVKWSLNKDPVSQTLNGDAVDNTARSAMLNNLGLTKNTSFTVAVTDEREATDSGTTKVYFYNGIYYGTLGEDTVLDSAAILSLTRKLQSGKALTFTANAEDSYRIAYALPSRYGTPNFNVGGFDGGFYLAATIDFTNASGYTETYDVWLSSNTNLGDTTVEVS